MSSSSSTPQPSDGFLTTLPLEIRFDIYDLLVDQDLTFDITKSKQSPKGHLAPLYQTCKTTKIELDSWFEKNKHWINRDASIKTGYYIPERVFHIVNLRGLPAIDAKKSLQSYARAIRRGRGFREGQYKIHNLTLHTTVDPRAAIPTVTPIPQHVSDREDIYIREAMDTAEDQLKLLLAANYPRPPDLTSLHIIIHGPVTPTDKRCQPYFTGVRILLRRYARRRVGLEKDDWDNECLEEVYADECECCVVPELSWSFVPHPNTSKDEDSKRTRELIDWKYNMRGLFDALLKDS